MLNRIRAKMQRVIIERENKEMELLAIQNEIKKLDGKAKRLNLFKQEYEELVNKFNQFIKVEFTKNRK